MTESNLAWFAGRYEKRLGRRYQTMRAAIALLLERTEAGRVVLETGCVRERNDYGAGYSTFVFGEVLAHYGGARISYHSGDAVALLSTWNAHVSGSIDLLYLDSLDYPEKPDDRLRVASQRQCLEELEAALPSLSTTAIVLIDDGELPAGGKPRLAKARLAKLAWTCVLHDYQTLWVRG